MNITFPIYNVIVVGFHHKRGCQVEFAFPPLDTEVENTAWKHLPTLAMPDGAHNFDRDTVYFHLPSLENPRETVFGVACYQQIDASKVKNKGEDVTRSTVQKSVCVLSRYPLYGHIQVKMSLITAAYFREGDFAQVSLLEEAYHNLNACLTAELLNTPEAFVGLSPRDLVFTFRHQVLILFKLLLLERKVLFRGASVGPMCSALLALVSLLPQSVEYGLQESACVRTAKMYSIVPQFSSTEQQDIDNSIDTGNQNINKQSRPKTIRLNTNLTSNSDSTTTAATTKATPLPESHLQSTDTRNAKNGQNKNNNDSNSGQTQSQNGIQEQVDNKMRANISDNNLQQQLQPNPLEPIKRSGSIESERSMDLVGSIDSTLEKCDEVPDFLTAVQITATEAGLPLQIFTNGYLCHPYLSLNYMDLLSDTRVKGFIVGATNILFKQKKDLVEVVVEMQDGTIDINCPHLKRLLTLTTQDLRFAESIVKQVTQEGAKRYDGDNFMDGVGWEGGDEWIRAQFKYYLMCLMRTSVTEESTNGRQWDCFGSQYIQAWQGTSNWKKWNDYVTSEERETPGIYSICPGHPNGGNISMSDMKIRLSHAIHNTEGGRRLNHAVTSTGRAVAQTGKAVGGALHSARGALSSWWGQVTTSSTTGASPSTAFSQNPIFEDSVQAEETGIPAIPTSTSTTEDTKDSKAPTNPPLTCQNLSQSNFPVDIDNID